ncbi:MAG: hypothetical protein LBL58_02050 [Tannerellaceae bacterium]|jgi:hypothetical protein|nr:hypothetical protein [Tannerellaceae bacterium]
MLSFKDIKERLTGISCPFFGISWNPPESERKVAQRVIRFLEDRRVLYNPSELESPRYCVESVCRMREYLTSEMQQTDSDSNLFSYIKAMRISCRKFLDRFSSKDERFLDEARYNGNYSNWVFGSALGEMRGTFGNMIAQISAAYGIDIEDDLATIIPEKE